MRTTVDMPDALYRTLKARAALIGVPLRELVQRLIEAGLRSTATTSPTQPTGHGPPPVIIPAKGKPIQAVSTSEFKQLDDLEDERRNARFA